MPKDIDDIRAQVADSLRKAETSEAWAASNDGPPAVGDLYTFPTTASLGVEWVAVVENVDDANLLFVVPFDSNPMVGTWDVAVSEFEAAGEGALRCGRGFWLHTNGFSSGKRGCRVEQATIEAARNTLDQMVGGSSVADPRFDVDDDPDYQEWISKVSAAAESLEAHLKHETSNQDTPDVVSILQFNQRWATQPGIREAQTRSLAADSDGLGAGPSEDLGVAPGYVLAESLPGVLVALLESQGIRLHYHPAGSEAAPAIVASGETMAWRTLPDGVRESAQLFPLGCDVEVELPGGRIVTMSSNA